MKPIDKLEAISRINETILTILDINLLLKKVLDLLRNSFGFDSSAILLIDDKTKELYIRSAIGYDENIIKNFRTSIGGKGITGYVSKTLKPLYIPDTKSDPRYIQGVNEALSEIAIPLIVDHNLIGVLDIESKKPYSFTDDDFEALCLYCSHISVAIHNALLFENERKKNSQLTIINKIRQRISVKQELDNLLKIVAQSIIEFFGYYQVFIYIYSKEGKLELMARAGLESSYPQESIQPDETTIVGEAFVQKRTVLVQKNTHLTPKPLISNAQSELAIPIQHDTNPFGVIYIASSSRYAFEKKDIHVLEVIGEQLCLIIRDIDELSAILKKTKQMEIIHRIGLVAIQSFDIKKFFNDIVVLLYDIFGYYHVSLFIYEKISETVELVAFAGESFPLFQIGDKVSIKEGIVGFAVRSGKPYLCNDTSKDPHYIDRLVHTKSELAIPIKFETRILGAINIESNKLNQFIADDVEIFQAIADQIACTLVNAELYKRKSSAHNLLLNLNSLGREINSTFNLKQILTTVITTLPDYCQCRLVSIFFYYPDKQELVLMAHNIPGLTHSETVTIPADGNYLMSRVISLKRSIHISDIEKELGIQKNQRYETKSFLNILLQHQDKVIGVLNLTDKLDQSTFSSEEFYLINSFAEHLSTAIINSEKYQKILELSITDGLTGLYVHRYFQQTLEKEIQRSKRYHMPLSLIMLDFDNFKQFNDRYGHQCGDIILREIAMLIRSEIREYDTACRYGGEEFGIILPSTSLSQAVILANRLKELIANHSIEIGTIQVNITVSQGVCEFHPLYDKETFIHHADMALYQAKQAGRNRVICCSPEL